MRIEKKLLRHEKYIYKKSKCHRELVLIICLHMATISVCTELKAINCFPEHTFQHLRCYFLNCIDNTISNFD